MRRRPASTMAANARVVRIVVTLAVHVGPAKLHRLVETGLAFPLHIAITQALVLALDDLRQEVGPAGVAANTCKLCR